MREHLLAALDSSLHSEIRFLERQTSSVAIRGAAAVPGLGLTHRGGTVRCLVPGGTPVQVGFSTTGDLPGAVRRAVSLAREFPGRRSGWQPMTARTIRPDAGADQGPPVMGQDRLLELAGRISAWDRRVVDVRIDHRWTSTRSWVVTTEGVDLEQVTPSAGISVLVTAEEGGVRSHAVRSLGTPGSLSGPALDSLVEQAGRTAIDRLKAVPLRVGRYPVLFDRPSAGALMHRIVGHLLMGGDDKPGCLPIGTRVGPESLGVGDDGSAVGLRGSIAFDDEGTAGQNTVLIQNGVVVQHLHSRETAGRSPGATPTGNLRCADPLDGPLLRPTNTYISRGQGDLNDLLSDIALGVYCEDAVSLVGGGSYLGFRPAAARMIRDGKLAEPVTGVVIESDLLSCLSRIEGIAGDFVWDPSASWCAGPGPGSVPVSTGAPHVRMLDISLGVDA